jgi:choline monooxygenase
MGTLAVHLARVTATHDRTTLAGDHPTAPWLPLDDYVFHPEYTRDFIVEAHWALYCENYLEGFHIPFVHAGLNSVIDFGNYTTELFRHSSLQLGIAKEGEDCFDLPLTPPTTGRR